MYACVGQVLLNLKMKITKTSERYLLHHNTQRAWDFNFTTENVLIGVSVTPLSDGIHLNSAGTTLHILYTYVQLKYLIVIVHTVIVQSIYTRLTRYQLQ